MKRQVILILALLFGSCLARASEIPVGFVSFDEFIPASGSAAGINAFDVFNFTGPSFGPVVGPPYSADSLTFTSASLTVNFAGGSSQSFILGDIGPGELLDSSGNPVIQFPSTDNFSSAIFTATLSPTTFTLSDGTTFTASGSIPSDLTPSGPRLIAGTDFAVVNAEQPQVTPVPEPGTLFLLVTALTGFLGLFLWKRRWLQV